MVLTNLARDSETIPAVSLLDHGPDDFHGFHERLEFIGGEVAYPRHRSGWYHEHV